MKENVFNLSYLVLNVWGFFKLQIIPEYCMYQLFGSKLSLVRKHVLQFWNVSKHVGYNNVVYSIKRCQLCFKAKHALQKRCLFRERGLRVAYLNNQHKLIHTLTCICVRVRWYIKLYILRFVCKNKLRNV